MVSEHPDFFTKYVDKNHDIFQEEIKYLNNSYHLSHKKNKA